MLSIVQAMRTKLLDDSLLFSGIENRLYSDLAPTTQAQIFPFGVVAFSAGGTVRKARTRMAIMDYSVKVISTQFDEASALGERIYEALHEADLVASGTWAIWRCQCDTKIHYVTVDADQKRYWHDGWTVVVRLNQ